MHFLASARYEVTVMLQNSKFVNTKAYNKANQERKYPALSRINMDTSRSRQYDPAAYQADRNRDREIERSSNSAESVDEIISETNFAESIDDNQLQTAQAKQALPRHGSVNLEALKAKEELAMQEEDWLTFFMGKAATKPAALMVTEDPSLLVTGFTEVIAEPYAPITTPPPALALRDDSYVEQERSNVFEEPVNTLSVGTVVISELTVAASAVSEDKPAEAPSFVPAAELAAAQTAPVIVKEEPEIAPVAVPTVEANEAAKTEDASETKPLQVPPISMDHAIAYLNEEISWTIAAHEAAKEIERLQKEEQKSSTPTLELPKPAPEDSELAKRCADALAEVERKAWGYTAGDKLKESTVEIAKPVEASKALEAAKTAEIAKPVEASKPLEADKTVEIAKPVEATKALEVEKTVEIAKPVEASKPLEVEKLAEASKAVEVTLAVEAKGAKAEITSPEDKFCLDDIFNDMISDDQIFRRSCKS